MTPYRSVIGAEVKHKEAGGGVGARLRGSGPGDFLAG